MEYRRIGVIPKNDIPFIKIIQVQLTGQTTTPYPNQLIDEKNRLYKLKKANRKHAIYVEVEDDK